MRILVVDDEAAVHTAYRPALEADTVTVTPSSLEALGTELFGDDAVHASTHAPQCEQVIDTTFVHQGLNAVALIGQNWATSKPFQVAFIDVRMSPGIDGKETALRC